ncbi:hypothetical protein PRUPE_6G140200 [Prunus persica]|uniref:Uncharacterized protein n=1 Tax=Prunus persica TaxID=3760 RepID=A0A251NQ68_PRUPE|nr:hypothetical protein PRUPE_6G140200 [Prunus persica]
MTVGDWINYRRWDGKWLWMSLGWSEVVASTWVVAGALVVVGAWVSGLSNPIQAKKV